MAEENIRLAIVGATGMAGREALLHQQFLHQSARQYGEITCVTASPRNVGRQLGDVIEEKEKALKKAYHFWNPVECPESLQNLEIDPTDPDIVADKVDYVISAVGSSVADRIEPELTKRGVNVFSNASSFRWKEDVPLLIPEVNYGRIDMVRDQQDDGAHVCNPNCTTAGFVPVIKALEDGEYSINSIYLTTLQALSGKGDGITGFEYVGKAIANARDDWSSNGFNSEEWKSAWEPQKILGRVGTREEAEQQERKLKDGEETGIIPIFTQTSRISTQHGHLEELFLRFNHPVDGEKIEKYLGDYQLPEKVRNLPTTPENLFIILEEMPNQKEHTYRENGVGVVVGDIKQHSPNTISLWTLTHNLRRGATWAGRQGLELYLQEFRGYDFD